MLTCDASVIISVGVVGVSPAGLAVDRALADGLGAAPSPRGASRQGMEGEAAAPPHC